MRHRWLLVAACALAGHAAHADALRQLPARRVLHVSLYPFIPEPAAAALALKQGFERQHPDVIVDVTFNPNAYSLDPANKGVLYEKADIHEFDAVLLRDMLARHRLLPLPTTFLRSLEPALPIAAQAATVPDARGSDETVGVPHWICTDFLIYRADRPELGTLRGLPDLERSLGPDRGLLIDMKGEDTLGELYLGTLLANAADPQAAPARIGASADPMVLARLRRILALEPPGLGRNLEYDMRGGFYARQFARRAGDAFVGYSEMMHEVLDETAQSCRLEDRCVTADQLRVAAVPFADGRIRPAVWVDMFGIDTHVHGATLTDAEEFIRYAVSIDAYRQLLIPQAGDAPRYLLPASRTAYSDPGILAAAPLYPALRAIVETGMVVRMTGLTARLHDVAAQIDTALSSPSDRP